MKAVVWHNVGKLSVDEVPDPVIGDSEDAIVRITTSAICGTDLHFVRGTMLAIGTATWLRVEEDYVQRFERVNACRSERLPVSGRPGASAQLRLYWCERCSASAALACARAFSASASLAATSRCAAALSCWASPSCLSDSFPATAPTASLARPFTSSTTPSAPAAGPDSLAKIVSHFPSTSRALAPTSGIVATR
jgi:hypothetical protein